MANYFQTGWNTIFNELPILQGVNDEGFFDISANEIKKISKREPRLMTKIDFRKSLPNIMLENDLSILAIKNGLYRIARTDPFINIPDIKNKEKVIKVPSGYISVNPFDITSESMAMDIAKISGMMDLVFGEISELTIRGRLRKGAQFNFELQDINYKIDGVQIEVDGGYEGATSLNLIEAKIGSISNISIRQLLYPELAWNNLIGKQKKINTYIFLYENPFFRFIPVIYVGGNWFADGGKEFVFKFHEDKKFDIYSIKISDTPKLDYSSPLPQADSFDKVLIMLRIINNNITEITKEDLELEMVDYDLHTSRQIDYYSNCLKMFGLIEINRGIIKITSYGKKVLELSVIEQAYELATRLFSDSVFYKSLHEGIDSLLIGDFEEKWGKLSDSTFIRRKSTIKSWITWFHDVFNGENS